jgi:multidrug resistance efflux pump
MNRQQILTKLKKVLGPNAFYRHDPKAPDESEREEARAIYREAAWKVDPARQALERRRAELLADPEYVRLREQYQSAVAERDKARAKLHRYPITAGRSIGIGNVVEAQGDTWAEVFARLEARH